MKAFDELLNGESVLHTIHRHRIILFTKIFHLIVHAIPFFAISIGLYIFQGNIFTWFIQTAEKYITIPEGLNLVFQQSILGINGIITLIFLYKLWRIVFDWKHDRLIISNQRVIHVDQHFLWGRHINFVHLHDVINLSEHHHGFIHTLFHYGTIVLETSSAVSHDFTIRYVPHPDKVIQMIENTKLDSENQHSQNMQNQNNNQSVYYLSS